MSFYKLFVWIYNFYKMISDTPNKITEGSHDEVYAGEDTGLSRTVLVDGHTLGEDFSLYQDIEEALQEKEIMTLRSQLKKLKDMNDQAGGVSDKNEHTMYAEACFGLPEEIYNPVSLSVDFEEYEIGNYLQKLHIKNHVFASKEVVHDFISEDHELSETDHEMLSAMDEMIFEDIRQAAGEKEIIDLRANLQSIAQSVSSHERTFEEIECFASGELDHEIEKLMREEAMTSASLSNEIDLHKEISQAIEELDIMQLRSGLQNIIQNEYSHSRSIEEIDGYLTDDLDAATMALFEDELMVNTGLGADLAFHREVDKAIAESEVISLRSSLHRIAMDERDRKSERLGIVSTRRKSLFWYAAASVLVFMVVFTSLVRHKSYTGQQLYTSYYQPYRVGASVSRSASVSQNSLNNALLAIDRGEYSSALNLLESSSLKGQEAFTVNFYSGVAYQELGEYNRAIGSFTQVVQQGDNLLVEQSEWYIGLCYLRADERQKALAQFRSIASRNGFYGQESGKILKQLE